MNMLYEGLKSGQSTIVIVPSSALQTMALGEMTGMIALGKTIEKEHTDTGQQSG
jgi:ABC-type phosphate transport system ATPase subunit